MTVQSIISLISNILVNLTINAFITFVILADGTWCYSFCYYSKTTSYHNMSIYRYRAAIDNLHYS